MTHHTSKPRQEPDNTRDRVNPGPWRWSLEQLDDPTLQHVALALSVFMNGDASAEVSVDRLASFANRREETVRRALRTLEAGGWLEIRRRGNGQGGRRNTNLYLATLPGKAPLLKPPSKSPLSRGELHEKPPLEENETPPPEARNPPSGGDPSSRLQQASSSSSLFDAALKIAKNNPKNRDPVVVAKRIVAEDPPEQIYARAKAIDQKTAPRSPCPRCSNRGVIGFLSDGSEVPVDHPDLHVTDHCPDCQALEATA